MAIELLYFSWVREAIGTGAETVDPPPGLSRVNDLIDWLATLSEGHASAFADRTRPARRGRPGIRRSRRSARAAARSGDLSAVTGG